jgi:hypothetical protein
MDLLLKFTLTSGNTFVPQGKEFDPILNYDFPLEPYMHQSEYLLNSNRKDEKQE